MLDPRDRGLAYGDGLFETLRVTAEGRVPLWAGHHRRLQQGVRALGLPVLPECRYQAAIAEGVAALAGKPGVVKLTLTRGPGGRGAVPWWTHGQSPGKLCVCVCVCAQHISL